MADHIALYRKYRPQTLASLVGQDAIKRTLLNAAKTGRMAQVYLFAGPRGTGKTTTARLIAKILNCSNLTPSGDPCNECAFCTEINDGRMMDVIEVDGASNRGIDEVRQLRENALFAPSRGKKKVFIIDEVHMLTKEAFNALLKTLEEPVAHSNFILATTEVQKIPSTILSRAQHFDFHRITPEDITERVAEICTAEGITADPEALQLIARAADGSLRDALVLVEQLTHEKKLTRQAVSENLGLVRQEMAEKFLTLVTQHQTPAALNHITTLYAEGVHLSQFTRELLELLRTKMLVAASEADTARAKRLARFIEVFSRAEQELKTTLIPQLPLELAVIEIADAAPPSEEATPSVKTTEQPATNSSPLTVGRIREHWHEIIERIATPKVRLTLRSAQLAGFSGKVLTLLFPSQFELEKINTANARQEIEEALKRVLAEDIAVTCGHNPAAPTISITTETIPHPLRRKNNSSPVDTAVEILGGTLIEE